MREVAAVVTARPSYSRIRSALRAIEDHDDLHLRLIVAGSALLHDYGRVIDVVAADGFEIENKVYMVLEGEDLTAMAKSTGLGLLELATALDNIAPDVVLTVADRYETISTAIAAAYMNIPLAHVQGGEVTGSIDEKVRHAVTKLADLHFVSTKQAKENVIRMGENPDHVHLTGCPSIDIAVEVAENPDIDFDPIERYGGVGAEIDVDSGHLVVLQHPVTTEYDEAFSHVWETLEAISELKVPTCWFWPNVDAGSDGTSEGIRTFREKRDPDNIRFFKNMAPKDFLKLVTNSHAIVGNSSVAVRECSYLGVPAINIGNRQNGRERGVNVIDVGYDRSEIKGAIEKHLENGHFPPDRRYGDGRAGERIASLLATCDLTVEKQLMYGLT